MPCTTSITYTHTYTHREREREKHSPYRTEIADGGRGEREERLYHPRFVLLCIAASSLSLFLSFFLLQIHTLSIVVQGG